MNIETNTSPLCPSSLVAQPENIAAGEGAPLARAAYLLKHGVFRLNTRRFGNVAEMMVQKLTNHARSKSIFHDLFDEKFKRRIEVKFSTVRKANKHAVATESLFEALEEGLADDRHMNFHTWKGESWICNIQQVKPAEFDTLYYGLFFADTVLIFHATSDQIEKLPGYSSKQHKGNTGEGQFKLRPKTLHYHMENHLAMQLSYEELAALLM